MGEGRAKAQALLLAALLLMMMSCSATASPYNTHCIPRRLLTVSGSYPGQRGPCNDDPPIHRPTPSGHGGSSGYRVPPPPPPTGGDRGVAEPDTPSLSTNDREPQDPPLSTNDREPQDPAEPDTPPLSINDRV